jgi:hypothetical protein
MVGIIVAWMMSQRPGRPSLQQQLEEQEFLQWCQNILNISTSSVKILHFPYHRSSIVVTLQKKQRYRNKHDEINDDDFERTDDDDDTDDSHNDDIVTAADTTLKENMHDKSNCDDRNDIVWIRGFAAAQDMDNTDDNIVPRRSDKFVAKHATTESLTQVLIQALQSSDGTILYQLSTFIVPSYATAISKTCRYKKSSSSSSSSSGSTS